MLIYFTGTGNSRYCAQVLADKLNDACLDSAPFIQNGLPADLVSERPWVFISPTYAWQLPRVFVDFIRNGNFSGSTDAYFVMTCGSDIGNAGRLNQFLCAEKGFRYRGTFAVTMPENYIVMFQAPSPAKAIQIIDAAQPVLDEVAACIQMDKDFPLQRGGTFAKIKSGIVNRLFYRFTIKTKHFTVSNACVSCGKCEKLCPLGNIHIQAARPTWNSHCTHCMACICGCPTAAINYGKATQGKIRYQFPICPD